MERVWNLYCPWVTTGHFHQSDQAVFYLCFGNDSWLPDYCLPDFGILERSQKIHAVHSQKPLAQPIKSTIRVALV